MFQAFNTDCLKHASFSLHLCHDKTPAVKFLDYEIKSGAGNKGVFMDSKDILGAFLYAR